MNEWFSLHIWLAWSMTANAWCPNRQIGCSRRLGNGPTLSAFHPHPEHRPPSKDIKLELRERHDDPIHRFDMILRLWSDRKGQTSTDGIRSAIERMKMLTRTLSCSDGNDLFISVINAHLIVRKYAPVIPARPRR